jgi:hypothetical protein
VEGLGFEAPRTRLHPLLSATTKVEFTSEYVRKLDLLAELTDVMSDGVSHDLWLLSIGIDNNPWGQYQPLIPEKIKTHFMFSNFFLIAPFMR